MRLACLYFGSRSWERARKYISFNQNDQLNEEIMKCLQVWQGPKHDDYPEILCYQA